MFTTPEGALKLTVMFFGLTNSPATFQTMINELLKDLINMGKVIAFINDVIVVIRQVCGQILGLGLVDRNRTVVIISLQQIERT